MIASSRMVAFGCAVMAVALHGASLLRFDMDEPMQVEGGQGAASAALGSSFADMAAGVSTPQPVEDLTEQTDPDVAEAPPPEQTAEPVQPETLEPTPEVTASEPVQPEPVATASPVPLTNTPVPDVLPPVVLPQSATAPTVTALAPVTPLTETTASEPPPETVQAQAPVEAETPPLEVVRAAPPEQVTQAEEDETTTTTPAVTPRPKRRTARIEERSKPEPKPERVARVEPAQAKPKPKPAGNSDQNARAGSLSGNQQSTSTRQGTKSSRSAAAGNAAVTNYPGLVMRRISRVSRPRVGSRGTAVVAFRVASNGGLSAVSVARSSGSPELDKAALGVIRKAAPFPAPPTGARRAFTIRIKGR